MEVVSAKELRDALPQSLKNSVSKDVLKAVNEKLGDPEVMETFRENLLSYSMVLQKGKFKLINYVNAVKYVSYQMMYKLNKDAFKLVFPDKMKKWAAEGVSAKDQASYIAAYNKSKLVQLVTEQAMIPVHVLNKANFQLAINQQVQNMMYSKSEMARVQAANSLMTHLKPPETTQIDISVTNTADSAIDALTRSTQAMIAQQKEMIKAGIANASELAEQSLVVEGVVEGEFTESDPEPKPRKLPDLSSQTNTSVPLAIQPVIMPISE